MMCLRMLGKNADNRDEAPVGRVLKNAIVIIIVIVTVSITIIIFMIINFTSITIIPNNLNNTFFIIFFREPPSVTDDKDGRCLHKASLQTGCLRWVSGWKRKVSFSGFVWISCRQQFQDVVGQEVRKKDWKVRGMWCVGCCVVYGCENRLEVGWMGGHESLPRLGYTAVSPYVTKNSSKYLGLFLALFAKEAEIYSCSAFNVSGNLCLCVLYIFF